VNIKRDWRGEGGGYQRRMDTCHTKEAKEGAGKEQYVKSKRILRNKLTQDRVRDFILSEAVRQMMQKQSQFVTEEKTEPRNGYKICVTGHGALPVRV